MKVDSYIVTILKLQSFSLEMKTTHFSLRVFVPITTSHLSGTTGYTLSCGPAQLNVFSFVTAKLLLKPDINRLSASDWPEGHHWNMTRIKPGGFKSGAVKKKSEPVSIPTINQ